MKKTKASPSKSIKRHKSEHMYSSDIPYHSGSQPFPLIQQCQMETEAHKRMKISQWGFAVGHMSLEVTAGWMGRAII